MVETIVGRRVENVVMYGHSDCEYTKFLAKSEECMSFEDEEQCGLYATAVESDSEADWKMVGQYNVLNELKQMLVDPVISLLVANGRLQMHGRFYNSATRQIAKQKTFIAVTK